MVVAAPCWEVVGVGVVEKAGTRRCAEAVTAGEGSTRRRWSARRSSAAAMAAWVAGERHGEMANADGERDGENGLDVAAGWPRTAAGSLWAGLGRARAVG